MKAKFYFIIFEKCSWNFVEQELGGVTSYVSLTGMAVAIATRHHKKCSCYEQNQNGMESVFLVKQLLAKIIKCSVCGVYQCNSTNTFNDILALPSPLSTKLVRFVCLFLCINYYPFLILCSGGDIHLLKQRKTT